MIESFLHFGLFPKNFRSEFFNWEAIYPSLRAAGRLSDRAINRRLREMGSLHRVIDGGFYEPGLQVHRLEEFDPTAGTGRFCTAEQTPRQCREDNEGKPAFLVKGRPVLYSESSEWYQSTFQLPVIQKVAVIGKVEIDWGDCSFQVSA